jgi:hypothetical protein
VKGQLETLPYTPQVFGIHRHHGHFPFTLPPWSILTSGGSQDGTGLTFTFFFLKFLLVYDSYTKGFIVTFPHLPILYSGLV